MTEPKHTPGPWRLFDGRSSSKGGQQLVFGPFDPAKQANPHIAWVNQNTPAFKEFTPNARLIAAAPDLLAEHEEWAQVFGRALMQSMQGDDSEWQHLVHTWRVRIQGGSPVLESAAIAKAKGEQ